MNRRPRARITSEGSWLQDVGALRAAADQLLYQAQEDLRGSALAKNPTARRSLETSAAACRRAAEAIAGVRARVAEAHLVPRRVTCRACNKAADVVLSTGIVAPHPDVVGRGCDGSGTHHSWHTPMANSNNYVERD